MKKIINKIIAVLKQKWPFLLLFGAAIFVRFYQLGKIPLSLYIDELAILVDAKSLANTGYDMHGKPFFQAMFLSYGDYKLPVYVWLAALGVKLFGVNEFALRLPSALAGVGTIFVMILLAKELFSDTKKTPSIVSACRDNILKICSIIVVGFSPWSLLFSRTGFEGHVGQFFLSLAVLLLFLSKKNKWLILVSPFVAALSVYTYFSVRFVWPIIYLAWGILFLFTTGKKFKSAFKNNNFNKKKFAFFVISGLIFIALLQPMHRNEYYSDSNKFRLSTRSVLNLKDWPVEANKLREITDNTIVDRIFYHRHLLLMKALAENYTKNLSLNFLFLTGDSNLRHGTQEHGLFLWPLIIPFLLGLISLAKNNFKVFSFLIIWWLIALLPASAPMEVPHALRSLNALAPIALLIIFGLKKTYLLSTKNIKLKFTACLYFLILGIAAFSFLEFYFIQYPIKSALAWQDKHKEFAITLLNLQDTTEYIYVHPFSSEPHLAFLAYDKSLQNFSSLEFIDGNVNKIDQKIEFKILNKHEWQNIFPFHKNFIIAGNYYWYLNHWPKDATYLKNTKFIYNSLGDKEFVILIYEKP